MKKKNETERSGTKQDRMYVCVFHKKSEISFATCQRLGNIYFMFFSVLVGIVTSERSWMMTSLYAKNQESTKRTWFFCRKHSHQKEGELLTPEPDRWSSTPGVGCIGLFSVTVYVHHHLLMDWQYILPPNIKGYLPQATFPLSYYRPIYLHRALRYACNKGSDSFLVPLFSLEIRDTAPEKPTSDGTENSTD